MARLIGPDFIALQVKDLEASRQFYTERLGLKVVEHSPRSGWLQHHGSHCRKADSMTTYHRQVNRLHVVATRGREVASQVSR
jgi:catechol 2,3-dioxygenase-like lactoylglutathione lyase family enzyme